MSAQNADRKFDMSLVYAVAKRCGAGYLQVLVCSPFSADIVPFPTLFWLTCPYLARKCGELESRQKISELESVFEQRESEVKRWHEEYSTLRAELVTPETEGTVKKKSESMWNSFVSSGAGGMNWRDAPSAVKCLHLQTAGYLGMGWHPAEDSLKSMLGNFECDNCICNSSQREA
ncbi:MAG: DUF501 domain-containing protein [Synergistaceae bacterium]|nr:DUF501 domain-containing protein [Synergistaceae bacterium]